MNKFQDKHIFISGGSRGIGYATASLFLDEGAFVTIAGRTIESVTEACNRLESNKIYGFVGDFGIEDDIKRCIYQSVEKFGPIDILINCVGIAIPNKFEDISIDEWNKVFATNLTSFFITSKLVIEDMKFNNYGKIINVSSIAGRTYSKLCGLHYSCSKAAVITMTKQLAAELGPFRINVNCVCPGQTYTDMLRPFLKNEGEQIIKSKIPLGYIADPIHQANVILFLASEEAKYINGAIVDVNGGQL